MNLNFEFKRPLGVYEKILDQCGGRGTDPHAMKIPINICVCMYTTLIYQHNM